MDKSEVEEDPLKNNKGGQTKKILTQTQKQQREQEALLTMVNKVEASALIPKRKM